MWNSLGVDSRSFLIASLLALGAVSASPSQGAMPPKSQVDFISTNLLPSGSTDEPTPSWFDGSTARAPLPSIGSALAKWDGSLKGLLELHATALAISSTPSAPTPNGPPYASFSPQYLQPQAQLLVGDLDGDGSQDLVSAKNPWDSKSDVVIRAIKGSNGVELWGMTLPEIRQVWMAGDVNLDSIDDLVLVRVDPPIQTGEEPRTYTIDQIISAVSGATGQLLWQRIVTATLEYEAEPAIDPLLGAPFGPEVIKVRNFLLYFSALETDTNHPSLFFDMFDVDYASATAGIAQIYMESYTESAILVASEDGSDRVRLNTSSYSDLPYTLPVADVNGDGYQDLIVWEYPNYVDGERTGIGAFQGLSVFSGSDGAHLWSSDSGVAGESGVDYNNGVYPVALSALGRSGDDLLLVRWGGSPDTLTLVDGSSGKLVWRSELPRGTFDLWDFVVGDIDGDGGEDFVHARWIGECDDYVLAMSCSLNRLELHGYSGRHGEKLWQTPTSSPDSRRLMMHTGDYDGDGLQDITYADDTTHQGGPWTITAISSRDGSVIWTRPDIANLFHAPAPVGGDLNRDGGEDLAMVELFINASGYYVVRTVVLSGTTGTDLWSFEDPYHPARPGAFAADLDMSLPGPELVQPVVGADATVLTSDGFFLWHG